MHQRYPKEVVLTDGKEIVLRPVDRSDTEKLLSFYRRLSVQDRWFLKEDPCETAVIQQWIDNQESGKAFCIVAVHGEEIVAHASLLWRTGGGRKHLGILRIMVGEPFRNKRLGTWMVFDLIKRAMDLGLRKMRADFVVGFEDLAIEAVRKLHFSRECVITDYVCDQEGRYHDCQIMIRDLHEEWGDF
jgi:L-amino acid N-acyltransferase YncA